MAEAREAAGWKQSRLSAAVECPVSRLKNIEYGRQWPPDRTFVEVVERELCCEPGTLTAVWDELQALRGTRRGDPNELPPAAAEPPVVMYSAAAAVQPPRRGPGRWRWVAGVVVACLVVAVLVLRPGGGQAARPNAARPADLRPVATAPRIVAPIDGEIVCYRQVIRGSAAGNLAGERLWLVVKPLVDPSTYPQTGPLDVDASGPSGQPIWVGTAFFGTGPGVAGGEGAAFKLILVSASSDADARLRAHRERLQAVPEAGLPSLPDGSTLLHSIVVTRGAC